MNTFHLNTFVAIRGNGTSQLIGPSIIDTLLTLPICSPEQVDEKFIQINDPEILLAYSNSGVNLYFSLKDDKLKHKLSNQCYENECVICLVCNFLSSRLANKYLSI